MRFFFVTGLLSSLGFACGLIEGVVRRRRPIGVRRVLVALGLKGFDTRLQKGDGLFVLRDHLMQPNQMQLDGLRRLFPVPCGKSWSIVLVDQALFETAGQVSMWIPEEKFLQNTLPQTTQMSRTKCTRLPPQRVKSHLACGPKMCPVAKCGGDRKIPHGLVNGY